MRDASAQHATLHVPIRSASDSVIGLSQNFLLSSTIELTLDSSLRLLRDRDFRYDSSSLQLILSQNFLHLLFPSQGSAAPHTLKVTYAYLPLSLKRTYVRNTVQNGLYDSITRTNDTLHAARLQATAASTEQEATLNFQKSGSIRRGFELGSNRDLALTSGFNLQFSGNLLEDVTVTGALNEEATPIQPEGNTEALQEVDKIYIEVKAGEHFKSTFGDFFLDLGNRNALGRLFESANSSQQQQQPVVNRFTAVSRKLLGVQAEASYPSLRTIFSAAATRGEFNTNTITGQEAYQGPYRLTGKNGERAILIVAGTERVYVDGVLQTRGEKNDYVIDYALAEVTFQPRRLITSTSRIVIDFEYSDQQYSRSLLGGQITTNVLSNAVQLSTTYLREGDNQDAPLSLSLSDSDRTILRNAGSDPSKATRSGVVLAPTDLSGRAKGSYVRSDTVLNGVAQQYYRYAPLDTVRAIYNVSFGLRGANKGSYVREGIGNFTFVGFGHGDYDTLISLPLPQMRQVLEFSTVIRPTNSLYILADGAGSDYMPNRFADNNTNGTAYTLSANFNDSLRYGARDPLRVAITANLMKIGNTFQPLDRITSVEYLRSYGLDLPPSIGSINDAYTSRDLAFTLSPIAPVQLQASFGTFDKEDIGFSSRRTNASLSIKEDSLFPATILSFDHIPVTDSAIGAVWSRWNGSLTKQLRLGGVIIKPFVNGLYEQKLTSDTTSTQLNSTLGQAFRFQRLTPGLTVQPTQNFTTTFDYSLEKQDSAVPLLTPVSNARTFHFSSSLNNATGFSTTTELTVRSKEYLDSSVSRRAGGNNSSLLFRLEPHYSVSSRWLLLDGLYEISNQRSARLERQFFAVPAGYGSYKYLGDLNGNGKQDPEEFQLATYADEGNYVLLNIPTEQLFPTTDLKSLLHVRLDPRSIYTATDSSSLVRNVLSSVSFESSLRLNETSTDPDPNTIYFFNLSHFQNPATTIQGLIESDNMVNLLENDLTQSYRFRYLTRRGAAQYNTGLERTSYFERSIRARVRPANEISNETTVSSISDNAETPAESPDRAHATSLIGIQSEWSYHPSGTAFDYGLRLEYSNGVEHTLDPVATSIFNSQIVRSAYALAAKARIRAELERDELLLRNVALATYSLPYSFTGGRTISLTWLWRLAFDYNIGSGVILTFSYDGRNVRDPFSGTNDRQTIHNGKAEIRASF